VTKETQVATDRVKLALDVLDSPAQFLALPETASLDLLIPLRARLGINDSERLPAQSVGERLSNRWASASRKDALAELVTELVIEIDRAISAKLDAGETDQRLIRCADFSDLRITHLPAAEINADGSWGNLPLYVGILSSLPSKHFAHAILPDEELYRLENLEHQKGIVLGRPIATTGGIGPPRRFYPAADCVLLTTRFRTSQLERQRQREEEHKREEVRRRREFWDSPLGELERRQRALDALRQKGEVPDFVPADPVIRVGR